MLMQHIVVRMWMALVVQLSKCLKLLPKMLLPAMLNVKETRHVSRFVTLQPARLFVAINVILLTATRRTVKKQNAQSKIVKTKNKEGADYE